MDRVHTYAALDEVLAADLNAIQDDALGIKQLGGTWIGERPNLRSLDGHTVVVSACGGLVLGSAVLAGTSGIVLTPPVQGGNWYYVYATNNAGAIGYETDTQPPGNSLVYDSTDVTRRYVGCFPAFTDTSTNAVLIPRFAMSRGQYRYRQMTDGFMATNILGRSFGAGRGTATALTAVNCGAVVPSHAKVIYVDAGLSKTANNGTLCAFHLRSVGQDVDEYSATLQVTPGVATSQQYPGLVLDYGVFSLNLGIEYSIQRNNTDNNGQSDVLLTLNVTGFDEVPWQF